MLGPDAVSITYTNASGRLVTARTAGPDGAFLVISSTAHPHCTPCNANGDTNSLNAGVIRQVHYRSGYVCNLPVLPPQPAEQITCPRIGYVPLTAQPTPTADVATTVTARNEGLQYFCRAKRGDLPCGSHPAPTPHRVPFPPEYVLAISFTARVAVRDVNSHYTIAVYSPTTRRQGCPSSGAANINLDIHPGQRIQRTYYIGGRCTGTYGILVTYQARGARPAKVGTTTVSVGPAHP
jgi:hypothetical protein